MEIPYIVTPRKDTGLINSKIAIWLFLASEVMLFGGFFSAYVYLRLGADYPWPERTLPVIPGLINTFVLIASSVTVVFAWASLKLRQWYRFKIFMSITLLCAVTFLGLKALEYNVKFHHQAVRLIDYTVIEGHLGVGKDDAGRDMEENQISVETKGLRLDPLRYYKPWIEDLMAQASAKHAKITLAEPLKAVTEAGNPEREIAPAGSELTFDLLARARAVHLAGKSHNAEMRTNALKEAWHKAHAENPGVRDDVLSKDVNPTVDASLLLSEIPSLAFQVVPAVEFHFAPRDIAPGEAQSHLRDDTVVVGKLLDSPMNFHRVDAIDFRHLAMKAEERGVDPMIAIEKSWLLAHNREAREAWEWHKTEVDKLRAKLLADYGVDKQGNPKRVPTTTELYRIGWKDFVAKAQGRPMDSPSIMLGEEFTGPNYEKRAEINAFPQLEIPRDRIRFAAKFSPAWNTYYAIYFTMTGLHGLHVIGGALVLAYYLFFGRKMYESNPEWLANRVEIGGLFWHFVDLVWIFLFPILYLM